MAKKTQKAKEPVRIRFKELADGNKSIYLDTYHDGKRSYEFLKLYIVPERTPLDKEQNKATMQAANAIKSQRIIELANGDAGIRDTSTSKMLLSDWMEHYLQTKADKSQGLHYQIGYTAKRLKEYKSDRVRLCDVDKAFCMGFLDYVANTYRNPRNGQPLSKYAQKTYYRCLNCALNAAVRAELIQKNPMDLVDTDRKPKLPESKRVHLTIEEVKKLIATDCKDETTKRAFLFCCFCGFRFSDASRLTWGDLYFTNGHAKLDIRQKKTDEPIYQPLNDEAVKWLPERGDASDDDPIFSKLRNQTANKVLKQWVKDAGIKKHVTFHVSRHSNATNLLTLGADIYTVSKLLGHKDVRTTEIYAKIIDKKKEEAVNLFNGIF